MLKFIVGDVDLYSAAVLVALALGAAVFCTAWIIRRRSRSEIANDFTLAKLRQEDQTKLELAKIAERREFDLKRLESGLITSHRSDH